MAGEAQVIHGKANVEQKRARGRCRKMGLSRTSSFTWVKYTPTRMHIFNAVELSLGMVEMEKIIIIFNPRVVAQLNDGQAELFT